jgi:two-component system, cell cycle response regulator
MRTQHTKTPVDDAHPDRTTPGRCGPLNVLVVDDDEDSRAAIARAVRRLGHRCRCAADGVEAWRIHREDPAHVILSDWMMPGIDGLELCKRVREEPGPAHYTHFIFVTGKGERERFLEGMAAGADDYIVKPFDLAALEARLSAACRAAIAYEALGAQNRELHKESVRCLAAASTDPLTHAASRLRLQSDLEAIVDRARRYGHTCCAAFCDVDQFKNYNDSFGHLNGDDAIRLVSSTIQKQLRKGDGFYRYGGDEFLLLLPEQSVQGAAECLERVRRAVSALPDVASSGSLLRPITISAGIAPLILTSEGEVIASWLNRADSALYRAKARGRNRVEVDPEGVPMVVAPGLFPRPRAAARKA